MATFDKKTNTLTIDDNENDRWIRTLPGFEGELEIHAALSKKLKKQKRTMKVIKKKRNANKD